MNQEMTEVPEYRKSSNAPSQNMIGESYKLGFKDGNLFGLKMALDQLNVLRDILTKTFADIEKINTRNPQP